ncbi:GNAT family N-acetyltransferase [Corynebacterium endometrii]|uniref:Acetyltransferase Pat n=1 Tax=Corynebacterium endometrii TaxID=2488819 RepID=A0A4P7QDS2_9CORY|nr:GNAT family N-acetyltransferase [Corynebacterium endometrii]QCB27559.1 Acetyltransferase Pat [Corynebacterium endometrii]
MTVQLNWEADVILNEGDIATLRPVRDDDRQKLRQFWGKLSDKSKYLRFFSTHPTLTDQDLDDWLDTDGYDKVTLVIEERDHIVAVASYKIVEQLLPARVGDVSFLVQDSHHGKGIGPILLEHLAEIGREGKIERFFAEMLTQNRHMVKVFIAAGYRVKPELEDGYITVDFTIAAHEVSREVLERRELRSEANSIRRLLNPKSVAVLGSIENVRTIIPSLVAGKFRGNLHILTTESADSYMADAIANIDEDVDLLLLGRIDDQFDSVLDAAARKNVAGIVAVAGSQNHGLSRERSMEIVAKARDHGIRALGPAALGIINTYPSVQLNASPAPMPRHGRVGLFTQSAGVATVMLSSAVENGTGLSSFIASGSYADVTGNDVIQYWSDDERTDICLLSLDYIGNPRKFFRVLHRLALQKHVVVFLPSRALKSARHYDIEGLTAATPEALDEVIRQTGSMVVTRRETMYNVARLLARQPLPKGNRVAVISNSLGLVQQMAQSAERFGLVPQLQELVIDYPVVGIPKAVETVLEDPTVDAVLVTVVDVDSSVLAPVHQRLESIASTTTDVPLVASYTGFDRPSFPTTDSEEKGQLPLFHTYADALEALSLIHATEIKREEAKPLEEDEIAKGDKQTARAIVEDILRDAPEGRWATDEECAAILSAYGVDIVPWKAVNSYEEAIEAAIEQGWDVVLKCVSPVVRGRNELPTVVRHIKDRDSMAEAWKTISLMAKELGLDAQGDPRVLEPVVQTNVSAGASLAIKAFEDPVLGPIVSVGMTGIASDLLEDLSWRVPPMRRRDARSMLESLKAAPLLGGYKGTKSSRMDTLEDVIMAVSALNDDIASVVDIELTPVIAAVESTPVVGARMRVAPLKDVRDPLARKIS